jgi:exopolyphosphatase/guanosine-5'-triphosphate,3'-diphosphate pyrophosphatase
MRQHNRTEAVAVIDIGSNSGRVMVFERDALHHLRLLAGSRAPLRLVHDVDTRGELSDETMARTTAAIRDFLAIAAGTGARRVVAVATAAMRDAANGRTFAARLQREFGIRLEIIGGATEGRLGFSGAVRGLAVSNGTLFDVGGGSMQITRFVRRRLVTSISLPLGALRLSEHFLSSDPPGRRQLKRLRDHVQRHLAKAGVKRLPKGDRLIGTGGTLRNLAKIDRATQQYPIGGLHAYELPVDRLEEVVERLAGAKEKRRDEISGLSAGRADSIVGGAIAIQTLAECVGAKAILVSAHGVREGIALGLLKIPVGSPDIVKDASMASLGARFDGWQPDTATRRRAVASLLTRALEPRAPATVTSAIDHAARLLDIGRSLDVVNRHEHVADILLTTELDGFTHGELALIAAIVQRAGDRHADIMPLALSAGAIHPGLVERAAIIVTLADEIEARCPRGRAISAHVNIGRAVTVSIPMIASWLAADLDRRFERAFKRALIVRR